MCAPAATPSRGARSGTRSEGVPAVAGTTSTISGSPSCSHHVLWRDQPSAPHQRAHVLAGAFVHGDTVVVGDVAASNGTQRSGPRSAPEAARAEQSVGRRRRRETQPSPTGQLPASAPENSDRSDAQQLAVRSNASIGVWTRSGRCSSPAAPTRSVLVLRVCPFSAIWAGPFRGHAGACPS